VVEERGILVVWCPTSLDEAAVGLERDERNGPLRKELEVRDQCARNWRPTICL
jgi:hypothetical protein